MLPVVFELIPPKGVSSYLMGTGHFAVESLVPIPEELFETMGKCERYYGETLLDPAAIQEAEIYAKDNYLCNNVSDKTWQRIEKICKTNNVSSECVNRFTPACAAIYLVRLVSGLFPKGSYDILDTYLWKRAKHLGLAVDGIQPIVAQYSEENLEFANIDFIVDVLTQQPEYTCLELKQCLDCLYWGMYDTMFQMLNSDAQAWAGNSSLNSAALELIPKYASIPCFYAVGMAHLMGTGGLCSRLENEHGYQIRRLDIGLQLGEMT